MKGMLIKNVERKNDDTKYIVCYTFIFAVIVIIGFAPFWINGKSFIWKIDGIGQYYPAFLYIGKYIREIGYNCLSGKFELPLFDLSIGMGEDVIGSLNYYGFGDPLNLFAIFATKENGAYVFTALFILRLYLSGITFGKYCSYMKFEHVLSCAGAICYVFSGYALIGGMRYIQFLSAMIYLPLILLGCEKILRERKPLVLVLSVAYAAVVNFYFLYMIALFLCIYCLVRCFAIFGFKKIDSTLKMILYSIGAFGIGIMLSSPILFPSIWAFLNSYRNSMKLGDILFDFKNYLISPGLLKTYLNGFVMEYAGDYWTGIPIIQFCCLILALFFHKTKRSRQCGVAVILGTLGWCVPITSIVFSGFGTIYTRWVFLLYFVYAVVFICVVDTLLETIARKYYKVICGGILLLVTVNIACNMLYLYGQNGKNWKEEFIEFQSANNYTDSPVNNMFSEMNSDELYRMANDTFTYINGRPENIAMINDYYGLTFWFSIVNGNVQQMVNQIGTIQKLDWRSYGLNNVSVYESLAGVKYYLQHNSVMEKAGYEEVRKLWFQDEEWKVFQNKNVLPLAYSYKENLSEQSYQQLTGIEKIDALTQYIIIDNATNKTSGLNVMQEVETKKTVKGDMAYVECEIDLGKETYLEIFANELNGNVDGFTLSDNSEIIYKGNRCREIIYNLGTGYSGKHLLLAMECKDLTEEEAYKVLEGVKIYALDIDRYEELLKERSTIHESDIFLKCNQIEIQNVRSEEEAQWMLLAVPYSKNWRCFVDGEETQIYRANTMYMAINLNKGTHHICFKYTNTAFQLGIILFFGACILIIVWKKRNIRS